CAPENSVHLDLSQSVRWVTPNRPVCSATALRRTSTQFVRCPDLFSCRAPKRSCYFAVVLPCSPQPLAVFLATLAPVAQVASAWSPANVQALRWLFSAAH